MGLWNKALSLLNNRFGSVPAAQRWIMIGG